MIEQKKRGWPFYQYRFLMKLAVMEGCWLHTESPIHCHQSISSARMPIVTDINLWNVNKYLPQHWKWMLLIPPSLYLSRSFSQTHTPKVREGRASDWVPTQKYANTHAIEEVGAARPSCSIVLSVNRQIMGQERSAWGQLEAASVWQEQEVVNRVSYLVKHEACLFLSLDTACKSSQPFQV